MSEAVYEWFAKRGITQDTINAFRIYVDAEGAVVFPYYDPSNELLGEKRRFGIPEGERSFRWSKGIDPQLYNLNTLRGQKTIILCEGETDTIRLQQEVGKSETVAVLGLPGIETWRPEMAEWFRGAEAVYVILDNDLDYKVAGRVDTAYRAIRADVGKVAKRVKLPRGVNDVCEFFEDYDLAALNTLIQRQPRAGESRFKTLDLTTEPPPVRWLVPGMFCKGDCHLLIGEPGLGKSWLTMALALAVAGVTEDFLGHPVVEHGRVLYFDEENPPDLVFSRFRKLGLADADIGHKIRYINNANARLDKMPDQFLEEALDFEPSLIVLDSLTRFHGGDENNSGEMARLFSDGIKPLARDTDAAVVVIHHANKSESNSGYKRARGSGDITASVDAAFDVRQMDVNLNEIHNFKSRRQAQGEIVFYSIVDTPSGGVALLNVKPPDVF